MTINQTLRDIATKLAPVVGAAEARAMANIIVEDIKGYTATQMIIHGERELLPETTERIDTVVRRVIGGEPLQYVLGTADFHGRRFAVNPSVLIPRPETSQLVDMIVDRANGRHDLRVLDVGTGSGCIAISLALDLPFAMVDAIDISDEALDVAAGNALSLKAKVRAAHADAYNLAVSAVGGNMYDIIVSNPPYILRSERDSMEGRVKDYEPELALFVDDNDPVSIYDAITAYAATHLNDGGRLYYEINPLCADDIRNILLGHGLQDVAIDTDYRGIRRFASATKR